ncbi:hypothetical protein [Enterococcus gallinarum]|uniref:hypothetical protein n=1 Tax=Enterococcus gallinarum TaxID=1353 RepID=UPI0011778C31|nr:hypothetical protein [Enterococcus gallinarum]
MSDKLIIQGKAWGEFENAKRSKGNIEISGYRSYGGTHTVRMVDQPQLNENQQIVVNDVKQDHENYGIPKFNAIHLAFTTYATGYYKDHLKNDEEFYQVLSTLIAWAQEQEEE